MSVVARSLLKLTPKQTDASRTRLNGRIIMSKRARSRRGPINDPDGRRPRNPCCLLPASLVDVKPDVMGMGGALLQNIDREGTAAR